MKKVRQRRRRRPTEAWLHEQTGETEAEAERKRSQNRWMERVGSGVRWGVGWGGVALQRAVRRLLIMAELRLLLC